MRDREFSRVQEYELKAALCSALAHLGWNEQDTRIALEAVDELVDQGLTNPAEIGAAAREMARDDHCRMRFAEQLQARDQAAARQRLARTTTSPVTGTKPDPMPRARGRSPHTVARSNTRQPGARWDRENEERQESIGGLDGQDA